MPTRNTFSFIDFSNEPSSFGVTSVDLTAANFDAQATAFASLQSAVDNLSIATLRSHQRSITPDTPNNVLPTDPYAQREIKWLVSYTGDTSGKEFQIEIPAPDLTDNLVPATDFADITSTDWAAFVTAFEAFARSPDDDTETVTVVSARLVGRNI